MCSPTRPGNQRADGIAVDEADGVAFANPGHGCIWIFDRSGVPKFRVQSCAGSSITNLAYDPLDRQRLVCTEAIPGRCCRSAFPLPGICSRHTGEQPPAPAFSGHPGSARR